MKTIPRRSPPFPRAAIGFALMLAFAGASQAAPAGGVVAAGSADISSAGTSTTITQTSSQAVINWQGFGIGAAESVRFVQPGPSSVALNRVLGSDPSAIFGSLSANGKVFLVNPSGILFGSGASVNVGGLVASTLNITDVDFMAGKMRFTDAGPGAVVNEGALRADGGYVALLGANVSNRGVISARFGSVTLAAGKAMTLDVAGDGLLNVTIDQGAVNALVNNGGMIQADGGQVLLTAQSAGNLMLNAVNNSGVIQAQTITSHNGTIKLLASMQDGTIAVSGTLDASAPHGGDGGFIETSAANVRISPTARITTLASSGQTGHWLIDPQDFTIGSGATDNISGATLSALLVTNSVTITTSPGPDATVAGTPPVTNLHSGVNGNGDINVNEAVSWTATPSTTTLTLNAVRDINFNSAVTAVNGNLVACCGRDINVNAPITTTNGSVLLGAGRNANVLAAMTTTNGNMAICTALNVTIAGALTITDGSSIPSQSLGLESGILLRAGTGGTGPGVAGGTVIFAPLAPPVAVTGLTTFATVNYNPLVTGTPNDYSTNFTLSGGAVLKQQMLVFADGASKTFDGTTVTTLTGLKNAPAGVTLIAGAGATANFDTSAIGVSKPVTFTGYTLGGPNAGKYALAVTCCGPKVILTTANIIAPPPVIPPVIPPVLPPVAPPPVVKVAGPIAAPELVSPPVVEVAGPIAAPELVSPQLGFDEVPTLAVIAPTVQLLVSGSPTQRVEMVQVAPVVVVAPPPPVPPAVVVPPPPVPYVAPPLIPKPFRN
jgi:filamentous hemagglutinin family protein